MAQRLNRKPGYPDYVKTIRRGAKVYDYFDTGQRKLGGQRIYRALPERRDPSYGGVYASLLAARTARQGIPAQATVRDMSAAYQRSKSFRNRSAGTQTTYGIYLRQIEELMGDAPLADVTKQDVRQMLNTWSPGAAMMGLLVFRQMVKIAIEKDWLVADPSRGIVPEEGEAKEYEPWPEHILTAGLADAELRLPIALMYYTAQRIGDVCRMRWDDVRDGFIKVTQQKTKKELDIRLHRELAAILAAAPRESDTILSFRGKPLKTQTLRVRIGKFGEERGVEIVPHGLRKNAVIKLLEIGCTTAETASISGQSLKMVEHYGKRLNTRKVGSEAIDRWERTDSGHGNVRETGAENIGAAGD